MTETQDTSMVDDLKKFYSVETEAAVILAQKQHIERLQERLRQLQPIKDNFPKTPRG